MTRLLQWLTAWLRGRAPASRPGAFAIVGGKLGCGEDSARFMVKVDGLGAFGQDSPPR